MHHVIENSVHGYTVYEIGTYGASSVLAGQDRKQYLESYRTLEEAQSAYPKAEEGYWEPNNTFTHLPGSDHLDGQGGVWGE